MRPIGIVDGAPAYNPGNYTQLSPGNFDTGEAQMGGAVVLNNVSPYDLLVWFDDQIQSQYTLHAWQPRIWDFCGKQRKVINFYPAFTPPPGVVNNAPASYLWGESYAKGEPVPTFYPADARINTVGNVVATSGSSNTLQNDGNAPGTQVIEMTPSDQASSSVQEYNDASGFHKILSAGVLRTVWNFIRGNSGTGKATLTIGDSVDTSILTVYATLGPGSVVPVGVIAAGTLPAGVLIPGSQVSSAVNQALQIMESGSAGIGGHWDSTNRIAHLRQAGFSGNVAVAIDGYNSTGGIFTEGLLVDANGLVSIPAGMGSAIAFPNADGAWFGGYAAGTVPTSNTAYLAAGAQGTESDLELVSVGQALSSIADWTNGYVLKINNYYDGTNDRFIAAKSALQIIFKTDQAVTGPSIQWRWNSGTPVAGGIITWYATQGIPFFDVFGTIDQGQRIWKGSSDPASSGRVVEGDLWIGV